MKKILMVLLLAIHIVIISGCNFTSDEINGIVDNVFENYDSLGPTTTGSYSQFKNINVEGSYLGYGYDVINEPYMKKDSINIAAPIIDLTKLQETNLKLVKENSSDTESIEASTMQEFSEKYAAALNVYGKAGKAFSGGLKIDFQGSSNQKSFYYFYKNIYQVKTFNLYLTDSVEQLKQILSEQFKKDLIEMEPENLFNKYGTHLIKEVSMGGRIEVNSTYSSESSGSTAEVKAAVNAHIKFLNSSINAEMSGSYEAELNKHSIESNVTINQFGGKLIDHHDINSLSSNYTKWVESFDENLSYSALSGIVGENSLVGLWELVPDENQERKNEIEQEFVRLSGDAYEELCSLFKLNTKRTLNIDVNGEGEVTGNEPTYEEGSFVNITATPKSGYIFDGWYLAGNKVSSLSTYSFNIYTDTTLEARFVESNEQIDSDVITISTFSDFLKIGNNPAGKYKLINNINAGGANISNVISEEFRGVLDGSNYSIYNFTLTSTSGYDSTSNCSLFYKNSGIIKNLTIGLAGYDTKISVEHSNDSNSAFICIYNTPSGKIENCTINNAAINVYSIAVKSYVGGICAQNQGIISRCMIEATIYNKGEKGAVSVDSITGGICAVSHTGSTIADCYIANSSITSLTKGGGNLFGWVDLKAYAANIVGFANSGSIIKYCVIYNSTQSATIDSPAFSNNYSYSESTIAFNDNATTEALILSSDNNYNTLISINRYFDSSDYWISDENGKIKLSKI